MIYNHNVKSRNHIENILRHAGISINGNNPWDIQVYDERLYDRVLSGGSVALGESYMDKWWDVDDMTGFFCRVLRSGIDKPIKNVGSLWYILRARFTNMQNKNRIFHVVKKHYDIGNNLYERMLDKRMLYTCGYWKDAKNLDEAQEAKLHLICKKLRLESGHRVLDIGCGWGGFAEFAAKNYGVHVVGTTISKEQLLVAQKRTAGLSVEIRLEDYRDTKGQFDRVVVMGMIEAVGPKNYRTYMKKIHQLLADDGLFLLQTIGSSKSRWTSDPWFHKYIFPNGVMPSAAQLGDATNNLFVIEDWHNFGVDYDKTLQAWYSNFERAWPQLKQNYDERFFRMWRYYLLSVAGGFRSRRTHLWQIVFSKKGVSGGYESVR